MDLESTHFGTLFTMTSLVPILSGMRVLVHRFIFLIISDWELQVKSEPNTHFQKFQLLSVLILDLTFSWSKSPSFGQGLV